MNRDDRGVGSTEYIVILPILVLVMAFAAQFALSYQAKLIAKSAAVEGTRAGRIEGANPDAAQGAASRFIAQAGPNVLTQPHVQVRTVSINGVDHVEVEVTGTPPRLIPGLDRPVNAVAQSPRERFR